MVPGLAVDARPGITPSTSPAILRGPTSHVPACSDRYLLHELVRQHREAERLLRRDDLRPDRQLVGHRRRALVRVRPRARSRSTRFPLGLPVCRSTRTRQRRRWRARARTTTRSLSSRRSTSFNDTKMFYALYSEGFRLGGENSPRAAETGHRAGRPTSRTTSRTTRLGFKSQWLDNRLLLNVSLFLMEWEDIQLQRSAARATANGAWWVEGNFNGGKAEQKGIELSGEWQVDRPLQIRRGAPSSPTRNSRRTRSTRTRPGLHRGGHDDAGLARGKVLGRGRIHVPGFLTSRAISGPGSPTPTGRGLEQPDAIEDFDSAETRRTCRTPWSSLIPPCKSAHLPVRLHAATTAGMRRSSFATLFDDDGYSYMSSTSVRRRLRRPPLALHPEPAAAAELQPVVHQAMVTRRHDLPADAAPAPLKLVTTSVVRGSHQGESHGGVYLIDLDAREVRQTSTGTRRTSTGRAGAGTAACAASPSTARRSTSPPATSCLPTRRTSGRIGSWRNPYLRHCHEISVWERTPVPRPRPASTASSASTSTGGSSAGRCTSSRTSSGSRARDLRPAQARRAADAQQAARQQRPLHAGGMYLSGLRPAACSCSTAARCRWPSSCRRARTTRGRSATACCSTTPRRTPCAMPGAAKARRTAHSACRATIRRALRNRDLDESRVARQGFARGLCVLSDTRRRGRIVAVDRFGLRPAARTSALLSVNLTMDVRNAIHGLEVWPYG